MAESGDNALFGLMLGALAVRSPYEESVSLSFLRGSLERRIPAFPSAAVKAVLGALETHGLVQVEGSAEQFENCRLRLRHGAQCAVPFSAVSTPFTVGALLLHSASLVQVSQLRISAHRLWFGGDIDEVLYSSVKRLWAEGYLVSHGNRLSDVDQWYVSLWNGGKPLQFH